MSKSQIDIIPASMVGLTIETPVAALRREARAKHEAWLNEATEANKLAYAHALKYWAREAGHKEALAYAQKLLKEDQPPDETNHPAGH